VIAFLFADDLFGLAHGGNYAYSVQTITPVTLYRMRAATLTDTLRQDADLAVQFFLKATHDLARSFRHTLVVSRRDAVGRLTMFLRMLEHNGQPLRHDSKIDMPMSRSDIANHLGLSLESVSRALSSLQRSRIVAVEGRHQLRVVDRGRFERIAAAL
jgi:CRP-like cAMP-binding protein